LIGLLKSHSSHLIDHKYYMKKTVAVITGTRAEYGLLKITMNKIKQDNNLHLKLIVTGAHLSPFYGNTFQQILDDGFEIDAKVDLLISSDSPSAIAKSIGVGVISFAQVFQQLKPDIILFLGDRYELLAAASAAIPFNIVIAHIAGGEITEGAIDERIRHSITKLSHLHFACAEIYKSNIIKLAEEAWRVHNVGHPCLELIESLNLLSKDDFIKKYDLDPLKKNYLVTLHTTTLNSEASEIIQVTDFFKVIKNISDANIILTYPNSDTNSHIILDEIDKLKDHDNIKIVPNLGTFNYLSFMKFCDLVIGNSSSGLVEGPYFKVPVINYGDRQKGRIKAINIIDCEANEQSLLKAFDKVFNDKNYQEALKHTKSLYGTGKTSNLIVEILSNIEINEDLLRKKFESRS